MPPSVTLFAVGAEMPSEKSTSAVTFSRPAVNAGLVTLSRDSPTVALPGAFSAFHCFRRRQAAVRHLGEQCLAWRRLPRSAVPHSSHCGMFMFSTRQVPYCCTVLGLTHTTGEAAPSRVAPQAPHCTHIHIRVGNSSGTAGSNRIALLHSGHGKGDC